MKPNPSAMSFFDADSFYRIGCESYRGMVPPSDARQLNEVIRGVCLGETAVAGGVTLGRVTDPLEDADDTAAIIIDDRILSNSGIKLFYILSGGLVSPEQRLAFLQSLLPGIEFGVEYKNYLTVYPDGYVRHEPFDGLLIAGPCHSATFYSLCTSVTKVVTFVGTDATGLLDPTLPAPINCKKTDVPGLLTADIPTWNQTVDVLLRRGIRTTSLPPEIGRFTAVPAEFVHPILEDQLAKARLMNLTSRPPAFLGDRLHIANSMVVGQWPPAEFNAVRFQHGSQVAEDYLVRAANTLPQEKADALKIPVTYVVIEAALRGAVYLPGIFGSPTKTFTNYLTPESIAALTANVAGLPTPMYDVAGMMILLGALGVI